MNAFYCPVCDTIVITHGKPFVGRMNSVEVHESLIEGQFHAIQFMGWYHPDFKQCEVEGTVRHNIETFGIGVNPPKLHDAWSLTSE